MYFGAQAALGYKMGQAVGNKTCRFIPWHLPSSVDVKTGLITEKYIVDNVNLSRFCPSSLDETVLSSTQQEVAESYFRRWKSGTTGFPWIDALMRQLASEGWIHHLGRHAVACFLTRGGCYIHWERGCAVFEELLIDHEPACNSGNWQWLSCTAFYSQFYRCYSPISFPKKTDKSGQFVRRYVPELKNFGEKYIYEPWKAPIADQKSWGCVIKGDGSHAREGEYNVYPKPMFDFPTQREICIQGMKKAYAVGLYGDDERVKEGTWKQLFDDEAVGTTEGDKAGKFGMVDGEERDLDIEEDFDGDDVGIDGEHTKPPPQQHTKAGSKRSKGQGTLDGHVKRSKK
jgi:cryptochrome